MAFLQQNWGQLSCSASQPIYSLQDGSLYGAPSHFSYISNTDTLNTIQAAGYFNAVYSVLSIGDCIHAVGTDLAQMFYVSAVTPNVNLIAMTGGGGQPFNWDVVSVNTQMAANNGYIADGIVRITLNLPVLANVGDTIRVTNFTSGWTVSQNAGQDIIIGSDITTIGAGGSLASTSVGDSLEIVCVVANTNFIVQHMVGNITVV